MLKETIRHNNKSLKKETHKVEFFRHNLSIKDKDEVQKVLNSLFLTTGPEVKKFEEKFASYIGSKFVVGVTSCTHALELSLRYFNIGNGDEVITTPLSFVATSNVIEMVGAKPIFVDVEKLWEFFDNAPMMK